MAEHNKIGTQGEELAVSYLQAKGLKILHRNWRAGHLEIDIVALDGEQIVFVEVKTRKVKPTRPSDVVSVAKMRNIVNAADVYMKNNHIDAESRFDIIILVGVGAQAEIDYITNAYRSYLR